MPETEIQGSSAVNIVATQRPGFFYGWIIAAVSGFGLAFGVSVFLPTTIGLFIGPFGKEFGWTPPQVLYALTVATLVTLFAAPVTGRVVDRFGVRKVVLFSFVAEALLIASFRYLDGNIGLFYLRYAALALFATGTTAISYSALISAWFDRSRGLGLGIALAGVGLGGVIWSLLTQYLFLAVGWRDAMPFLSGIIVLIVFPIQLFTVRDRPELMGLHKDGVSAEQAARRSRSMSADQGLTLTQAFRVPVYWMMLATFFLFTSGTYGIMINMVTVLSKQGVSLQTAAAAQATIWFAIVFGRIGTGWLLDRFFAPYVAMAFAIPAIAGISLLLGGAYGPGAFVAAMLIGLSAGGEIDVLAYLTGRYFGLRHFGVIYSTQFASAALATSVGPVLVATIAEANGGRYAVALGSLIAMLVTANLMLLFYPRYPVQDAPQES